MSSQFAAIIAFSLKPLVRELEAGTSPPFCSLHSFT